MLQQQYRFCSRCWMSVAPVRRCRCAPEPYPDNATPARVLAEHPQIRRLADAIAAGRYADDTATREQRHVSFLRWLYEHGRLGEHIIIEVEEVDTDDAVNR